MGALTTEDLEKVRRKNLANILDRLKSGKTLTAREEAFLEAERAAGPAKKYGHPYKVYAARYGVSLVTVKRWAKAGHPLDNAEAMQEYFSPRGKRPSDDAGGDDERGPESPIQLDGTFFDGRGVLAALERLQKAERERAAAYFAAIEAHAAPKVLKNRFQDWTAIVEALRKLELSAPEIRKANESSIDRGELAAALGQVLQAFRGAANNLPGRATGKLLGLTEHDEIMNVLEREVEVLLRTLTDLALDAFRQAEKNAAAAEQENE